MKKTIPECPIAKTNDDMSLDEILFRYLIEIDADGVDQFSLYKFFNNLKGIK